MRTRNVEIFPLFPRDLALECGYNRPGSVGEKCGENKEKSVVALSDNPRMSTAELSAMTGLSVSGVEKNFRGLKAEGRTQRVGPDRSGYWMVGDCG
jgi:predicted HTH transcriptional regulator